MQTERLFEVLSRLHPIQEEFKMAVERELTILSLPKNYHLLEAPRIAGHAYFLNNGSAVTYTFANGRKQIESLWPAGKIIVSVKSFFEQVPSLEFIQLLEPAEVIHISHASVLMLFNKFPEAIVLYRMTLQLYYEEQQERMRDFQSLTAKARYQKLRRSFPHVEQVVSQEMIASYLGITPQSLSRLKKRNGD